MSVDEAIALHLTRFRAPHLICPWCHCVAGKIACDVGQIRSTFPRIPCPPWGAFRDRQRRWVRDAVDACHAQDERM